MTPRTRAATLADLPSCLDLTARFHAASPISGVAPFDRDGMAVTLREMMVNPRAGVWLATLNDQPVGIAGALMYPLDIEATIPAKAAAAEAKRQNIRDKYDQVQAQIDTCATPDALKRIMDELK